MAVQARDIEVADGAHVVKFCEHDAELVASGFDAHPDSPGRARHLVVDALRRWGVANTLVDDAALVVSELAANAVRHADSSFWVNVSACGSTPRVVVHDNAPLPGTVPDAWLIPQPLHGLSLVDALCRRWGVESSRDGKLVWAELRGSAPFVPQAGG